MSSSEQPPPQSPEYEREVLSTPRFFRGALTTALVLIGLIVLVSVLGALLSRQRNESAGAAQDVHARLTVGAIAETDTESGRKVAAVITGITWEEGPAFDTELGGVEVALARVLGPVVDVKVEGVAVAPGSFTFVLKDGTVLELDATRNADGTVHLRPPGILPWRNDVRSVHFNPDDSHGDIYFDVE